MTSTPPEPTPPTPTPPAPPAPPAPAPPAPTPPAPPADPELGFPKDTPVAEMTAAQKDAYNAHMREKNREAAKAWKSVTGERTPEQLAADLKELEELRLGKLSDSERTIEEAKTQARTETVKELGVNGARVALEFALGHDPEKNDVSDLIDTLDLTKVLTDDGAVDTAKVRSLVEKIAPADKGAGAGRTNYGAGRRTSTASTGVAAGRSRYQERHGTKS